MQYVFFTAGNTGRQACRCGRVVGYSPPPEGGVVPLTRRGSGYLWGLGKGKVCPYGWDKAVSFKRFVFWGYERLMSR